MQNNGNAHNNNVNKTWYETFLNIFIQQNPFIRSKLQHFRKIYNCLIIFKFHRSAAILVESEHIEHMVICTEEQCTAT